MKCKECGVENAHDLTECGNCGHPLNAESSLTSRRANSPDSLERLLREYAFEREDAIGQLTGLKGTMLRALSLPQTIVFRSEIEAVTLQFDKEGRASVTKGEAANPKIVMDGSHSSLCRMLTNREFGIPESGHIRMTVSQGLLGRRKFEFVDGKLVTRFSKDLFSRTYLVSTILGYAMIFLAIVAERGGQTELSVILVLVGALILAYGLIWRLSRMKRRRWE